MRVFFRLVSHIGHLIVMPAATSCRNGLVSTEADACAPDHAGAKGTGLAGCGYGCQDAPLLEFEQLS